MVSTAANLVHRAPPLPISSSSSARRNRSSSSRWRPGNAGSPLGARLLSSPGVGATSTSNHYSSSFTNGCTSHVQQAASKITKLCNNHNNNNNNKLPSTTRRPLTIEEYERDYRQSASDLELVERVFLGGMCSNQLRSALWPYLFGLVKQRGRFVRRTTSGGANNPDSQFVYLEHEHNLRRWRELERLYRNFENQWKSIESDQELRFSAFRERKSLIERDVVRSDRTHPFYSSRKQDGANYADNLNKLTKLLMTYMMYDFDIGYLQGMSDLAAPILYVFQGDLVKSFWVFVEVMKLFRRNFEFSQKTIHFQLNCLFRLIKLTDPKLAKYLRESDCSNCFFVFRHIVCQFKRELMRASSDSQPVSPADSSASSNDEDNSLEVSETSSHAQASSTATSGATSSPRDDYANVLNLWDTVWLVQRRHELRARSRCVHTYKIAKGSATCAGHHSPRCVTKHCTNNNINQTYHSTRHSPTNGIVSSTTATNTYPNKSSHNSSSSCSNINNNNNNNQSTPRKRGSSCASSTSLTSSDSSISSTTSGSESNSTTESNPTNRCLCAKRHAKSSLSDGDQQPEPRVKQEQVVYTKETFYSSFDPNQADVPRFELTETEKFVISLCISLIRRERNYILQNRLDASEIHQHFIRPRAASDLDQFLAHSYEIYHFLNHECDLQSLVRGASEFADPTQMSPVAHKFDGSSALACTPDDQQLASSSSCTADTLDLLKDYFIITPTAYSNISAHHSPNSLGLHQTLANNHATDPRQQQQVATHSPARRKVWDRFVANSTPSIRYDSSNNNNN